MINGIRSETNGVPSEFTLLPCPLCGSEDIGIERGLTGSPRVWCVDCRCNTGGKGDDAEAIEAWNTRVAVTDHDFAMAVHDGELWGKCSECKERQGYYLDAETIQRQQERIAELEAERDHWQGVALKRTAENAELRELVRDMWFWHYEGHIDSESQERQMKHIDRVIDCMRELGVDE